MDERISRSMHEVTGDGKVGPSSGRLYIPVGVLDQAKDIKLTGHWMRRWFTHLLWMDRSGQGLRARGTRVLRNVRIRFV